MTVAKKPAPGADFAAYACELLAPLGRCTAKRMFGGFGISVDGLTVAIVADLGDGLRLWLKADETNRATYEAAGCARFTYPMAGVPRSMNYYAAPDDAMESPGAMQPWARLAWDAALSARAAASSRPTQAAAKKTAAPKKKA